eukprot:40206_1
MLTLALLLVNTICLSKSGTIIAQSNSSNVTNTDIYDTHTYVIFKFVNISIQNCDLIFNYINNGTIYKIEEIIESNYLNEINLPNYNLFEIKIQLLNGFDFINTTDNQFTKYMLYYQINYETGIREMYAKSVINHPYKYLSYFLTQSNDPIFWNKTTYQLQKYFNNTHLNFTVSNASKIQYTHDIIDISINQSTHVVFWILNALFGLCVLIGLAACIHNKIGEKSNCMPVDNANWTAIILYAFQIYNIVTDINLSIEILNSEVETTKEYVFLLCGIISIVFIILSYCLNLKYAIQIPNTYVVCTNCSARTWFEQYQLFFLVLVVFSGDCYYSVNLISSNIFGIQRLNTGLSSFELVSLSYNANVITIALIRNCPQLLVQIFYSYSINNVSQNIILAFLSSFICILVALLYYCINKDKEGQVYDIYYYFELKLKTKGICFTKD